MIVAWSVRGPGFKSRTRPHLLCHLKRARDEESNQTVQVEKRRQEGKMVKSKGFIKFFY